MMDRGIACRESFELYDKSHQYTLLDANLPVSYQLPNVRFYGTGAVTISSLDFLTPTVLFSKGFATRFINSIAATRNEILSLNDSAIPVTTSQEWILFRGYQHAPPPLWAQALTPFLTSLQGRTSMVRKLDGIGSIPVIDTSYEIMKGMALFIGAAALATQHHDTLQFNDDFNPRKNLLHARAQLGNYIEALGTRHERASLDAIVEGRVKIPTKTPQQLTTIEKLTAAGYRRTSVRLPAECEHIRWLLNNHLDSISEYDWIRPSFIILQEKETFKKSRMPTSNFFNEDSGLVQRTNIDTIEIVNARYWRSFYTQIAQARGLEKPRSTPSTQPIIAVDVKRVV